MRVITSPQVHVLSAPGFRPHPTYELPDHEIGPESLIATAGKVCYDSYGKDGRSVPEHIKGLVDSAHLSVIEHVHIGLFIEGISRGCSHEIVRHRMFNYSQRSTRYTAEEDAAIVLDPFYANLYAKSRTELDPRAFRLLEDALDSAERDFTVYKDQIALLEYLAPDGLSKRDLRKWCRGKARQWLPHALETRMVMTGNLRAWRHFLLMRTSRHAEAEIRRLAHQVYDKVVVFAPTVFADLTENHIDGYVELTETR